VLKKLRNYSSNTQILMTLSEIEFVSRTRNAATKCVLRAYNAAKCDCGRDSAPDPAGGAHSAPPDPLAGFKGAASRRGGEGVGTEREERGRGRGKGEEGRLTLMRSWNKAADWLRPALLGSHTARAFGPELCLRLCRPRRSSPTTAVLIWHQCICGVLVEIVPDR